MEAGDKNEKVKQALDRLDQGIQDFFQSEHFKDYIKVMGRFHHYSARNCILIASQLRSLGYPEDARICGYNDWKRNFNRQVKKGEKGIMILAPMKRSIEVEVPGKLDRNGDPLKEKKEFMTFRPVYVFSEHQTEGDPLPELVKRLDFEVDGYEKIRNALVQAAECPVIFEPFPEEDSINGYFNPVKNEIHIREGMSEAQTIKTLLHESLHHLLHPDALSDKSRQEKELEAEAGAFCVASTYLGIDTSAYSIPYLGSWAEGKSLKEMTTVIENIKRGSDLLISKLDRILCLEMTSEEAEQQTITEEVEKLAKSTGAGVENVTVVADQTNILAFASVRSEADEDKLIELNGVNQFVRGHSVAFAPINVENDNSPVYFGVQSDYQREGYDSSWPMVEIKYTNVPGVHKYEMNIYDFQKMIDSLPKEVLMDRTRYFKVSIAYTYNDRRYQKLQDIDLGNGRTEYIGYFCMEQSHVVYLETHMKMLRMCDEARHFAPGTEAGVQYEDAMMEWSGYCREILNHQSDHPVLPNPPTPFNKEQITEKERGISL